MECLSNRTHLENSDSTPLLVNEVITKSAIEKLPSEILLKIFKNCLNASGTSWYQQCKQYNHPDDEIRYTHPDYSIRSICMNLRQIRLVCSRFNEVSKDATLIKKLIINRDALKSKKNLNYILDTILRSKGLTHLYINIATIKEDSLVSRESLVLFAIQCCPKLSHLFITPNPDWIYENESDEEEHEGDEDEFEDIQLSDVCIASICEFAKNLQFLHIDTWTQCSEMCQRLNKLEYLKELKFKSWADVD